MENVGKGGFLNFLCSEKQPLVPYYYHYKHYHYMCKDSRERRDSQGEKGSNFLHQVSIVNPNN